MRRVALLMSLLVAAPAAAWTRYPAGRLVSPITPDVVDNLRAIARRHPRQDHVFAKVGCSITASLSFMRCLSGEGVRLEHWERLAPTIEHFRQGDAAGSDPFRRRSVAAVSGWSGVHTLRGAPSPLDTEIGAIDPRFALVMYGTNDIERRDIEEYAESLFEIVARLVERGVVPIVSTIPHRDDRPRSDRWVPAYNGVARAVAQAHQVPLVDLHLALDPLDGHGLGPDHLHPSTWRPRGKARACDFGPAGLRHGYNRRNLLTLAALDIVRRVVVEGEAAPDPPQPFPDAASGFGDPTPVRGLPFTHRGKTGGVVYTLELDRPTLIEAYVLDLGGDALELRLRSGPADAPATLAEADTRIEASLAPGTWQFAVDGWGDYLFVLVESRSD